MILPVTVLIIAGAALFGTAAYAQGSQNGQKNMVQTLAQKLGVDQQKVQTAFDEIRAEHQQEMQTQFTQRLNLAVTNGKISEEQKNLILKKHEEMQSQRESEREQVQNMTQEERRTFMESRREEMKKWADAQGIDMQYLMGPNGGQGTRGMNGMENR